MTNHVSPYDRNTWMTRTEAATLWGCHVNTVSRARQDLKHCIPPEDLLEVDGRWFIKRDTAFRPRKVGRPHVTSGQSLRRRRYYILYLPTCPDLRRLDGTEKERWLALIDRLVESGPEEFLAWYDKAVTQQPVTEAVAQ